MTLRAKQIKEAINVKAGVTDADVRDFFDEYPRNEEDDEGNVPFFFHELIFTFIYNLYIFSF